MRATGWFVLACGMTFAAPALADSSRFDAILTAHVLRVGTTGDYRPFTTLDKSSSEYSGFDIDLSRSLGQALGAKVEFVPTSWGKLARDLQNGTFDIAMGGVTVT